MTTTNQELKEPCVFTVVRQMVQITGTERRESYGISSPDGCIEELSLEDIIFIRNELTGLIKAREGIISF